MEALSGKAEVRYDSRSDPDDRGQVTCTAEVLTMAAPQEVPADAVVTFAVQALIDVDLTEREDHAPGQASHQVAEEATTLLRGVRGSSDVEARVVSSRPARAPRP
jgi:hypothetical protein